VSDEGEIHGSLQASRVQPYSLEELPLQEVTIEQLSREHHKEHKKEQQ
jgi:hypothetical protein